MAAYLRELDPYGHLVSTSFFNLDGDEAIWNTPGLDLTQSHLYGSLDLAEHCASAARTMTAPVRQSKTAPAAS